MLNLEIYLSNYYYKYKITKTFRKLLKHLETLFSKTVNLFLKDSVVPTIFCNTRLVSLVLQNLIYNFFTRQKKKQINSFQKKTIRYTEFEELLILGTECALSINSKHYNN